MTYNFDRVSDRYDETRGLPPGVPEAICRWVLARLPADPAIAEIGVGTGRIAIPFIQEGVRYTGFDISEQMVALLRAKLGGDLGRAQIHMADVTKELPIAAGSQDAVMAVHILHLVDAPLALAQIRRILKPNGALLWGYEWHDDGAPRQLIRAKFRQTANDLGQAKWRSFTVPEGHRLLADWGAQSTRHTLATWTEPETPRSALEAIAKRTMSFTWEVDDAILQESLRRTEEWARAEFGDLDLVSHVEKRFVADWYQF